MEKGVIEKLNGRFEEYAYEQDGIDYWLARELQELLGYADWRNFSNAINKAKETEVKYTFVNKKKTPTFTTREKNLLQKKGFLNNYV